MISKILSLLFVSLLFTSCTGQSSQKIEVIDATVFSTKLNTTPNAQLIDVRTPSEYNTGHIENAKNIDWLGNDFVTNVSNLDKSKPVFVYCKVGGRSSKAASKLAELGFTKIYDLNGGFLKWESAGLSQPDNKIIGICSQEYNELLKTDKTVLVNFYAPWCAPCKKMEPYILQMQKDSDPNTEIVRFNADENKTIMKELKIDELPTLLLYKNNEIVWKHKGYISEEELKKAILNYL
jgi:thioredoxin